MFDALHNVDGDYENALFDATYDDNSDPRYNMIVDKLYSVMHLGEQLEFTDIFTTKSDITIFLQHNPELALYIEKTVKLLQFYNRKKFITVYRSLNITQEQYIRFCKKDRLLVYNPNRIIQFVNNTTRKFNSFSTSEEYAKKFAMITGQHYDDFVICLAGEADVNDINFAFTAYLKGRHSDFEYTNEFDGSSEHELNINNIKLLRNTRLIYSTLPVGNSARLIVNGQTRIRSFIKNKNNTNLYKHLNLSLYIRGRLK